MASYCVSDFDEADVDFSCWCEPEDSAPEDSFQFPEDVAFARDGVNNGNEWAWCSVTVEARWEAADGAVFSQRSYLGGCSYRSREDFMAPDGYYPDMRAEALAALRQEVEAAGY